MKIRPAELERQAWKARVGLWADSTAVAPWIWRRSIVREGLGF